MCKDITLTIETKFSKQTHSFYGVTKILVDGNEVWRDQKTGMLKHLKKGGRE